MSIENRSVAGHGRSLQSLPDVAFHEVVGITPEIGGLRFFVESQFAQDERPNPTRFNFQNENPVRNFFNLSVGLVAVLPNGIQPYANFRAMVGNEQFNNFAGIFGLRLEQ